VIPFDRNSHVMTRLRLAFTIALTLAMLLWVKGRTAIAAPTEEDLPPVTAHHVSAPPLPSGPAAINDGSDDNSGPSTRQAAETADAPGPNTDRGTARPSHIANFFPYTIRPGDTPQSIANTFGLETAELTKINHITDDTGLIVGHSLRIPNPYLARMRELEGQVDRLSAERSEINQQATSAQSQLDKAKANVRDLTAMSDQLSHQVVVLPWWRAATYMAAAAAVLMFGVMIVALIEWLNLRGRFRAVAEMNEALRRLDYRYRITVAKAELRLQELYGRRRRGFEDGQDRPRIAEDTELERLHQQLKDVLETHLARLGPPGERARRARWRELIGGIGAPAEAEARSTRH
jgi:LysM repeat protein